MIGTLQNLKQTINERIKILSSEHFYFGKYTNWRPIFILLFSHDEIYNKIGVIDKNYSDWHYYFYVANFNRYFLYYHSSNLP